MRRRAHPAHSPRYLFLHQVAAFNSPEFFDVVPERDKHRRPELSPRHRIGSPIREDSVIKQMVSRVADTIAD